VEAATKFHGDRDILVSGELEVSGVGEQLVQYE
jgi:hypothetical protein